MKPPYQITPEILHLVSSISVKIGEINAGHLQRPRPELRRTNRIKTIQSSLEIEGNTLSIEQVTALLENRRVLAPRRDILEVKNAIAVYDSLHVYNPYSMASLLKAHRQLMKGLIPSAGTFRTGNVGVAKGAVVTHVAPPGRLVKGLVADLLKYLKKDPDPLLIKSCACHYELEFIHPFADGNGRIGRLWQTLLLTQQYPVFEYLPIEAVIKKQQRKYYQALSVSDKTGTCTPFLLFMLETVDEGLKEFLRTHPAQPSAGDRVSYYRELIGRSEFTRQDYMQCFKQISASTASRDLKEAVENKMLFKKGDKRTTVYWFR